MAAVKLSLGLRLRLLFGLCFKSFWLRFSRRLGYALRLFGLHFKPAWLRFKLLIGLRLKPVWLRFKRLSRLRCKLLFGLRFKQRGCVLSRSVGFLRRHLVRVDMVCVTMV